SKVTMDEIAEDVGMGKASIYYYFPTKEDIFREVIKREQREFLDQMQNVVQQKIPVSDKLRKYVLQRMKYSSKLFNLSSLNHQAWMDLKPIFKDCFNSFAAEEQKLLMQIIREGKQMGEFEAPSPEKVAHLILHVLQGLRLRLFGATSTPPIQQPPYEELEKETTLFIESLLYGILKRNNN
ncbi:MAG: TetR/AcrR family transcriptional regulator, partial [Bacteroidota bacterium]|nr:TetR/AcrR family transcriptional regulator [Bacteroidota bacterium]